MRRSVKRVLPKRKSKKIKNEIKSVENEAYTLQQDVRDKAVKDVQANQDLLRKDLEAILAEDLNTADIVTLRRRIVQLVMQVQEQHKNEAAKLVAVLNATETRTSEKIVESLKKQAEKYEELIQAKLTDQEITLRENLLRGWTKRSTIIRGKYSTFLNLLLTSMKMKKMQKLQMLGRRLRPSLHLNSRKNCGWHWSARCNSKTKECKK